MMNPGLDEWTSAFLSVLWSRPTAYKRRLLRRFLLMCSEQTFSNSYAAVLIEQIPGNPGDLVHCFCSRGLATFSLAAVHGRRIKNATLIQPRKTPTQHFPVQAKAPHSLHAVSLLFIRLALVLLLCT